MQEEFMTIKDFANMIKVHPNTIRNMIKSGRLNAFRVSPKEKSSYRIPRSEIHRIALEEYVRIRKQYNLEVQT